MKKLLLIIAVGLISFTGWSQQDPLYTNYKLNYFPLNPAAAGYHDMWAARVSVRGEWVAFPGAPVTETASLSGHFGKVGLGLTLFNDIAGIQQKYGAQLGYSYRLMLGDNSLDLGLGTRFFQYRIDIENARTNEPLDPSILAFENQWNFDLSFGAYLQMDKFYAGVSGLQLVQLIGGDADGEYSLDPLVYLMLGYKAPVNSNLSLEPSALLKYAVNASPQLDVNLKVHLMNEQFYFGGGFRTLGDASYINLLLGAYVLDRFHFGYSYDFSTNSEMFQQYSLGSHEVVLGIDFNWKEGRRPYTEEDDL